ncbi:hypothetical protein TSUD_324410 [Trifolium subterraneum]|uniref:Uncharacterized protein n=1 Tax=Trifolium subterraneum TaxID=3900 RepID=A0A2Z6LMZ0_TRISU|nr:hypothetical protein TSUD_324410 [Trifolium subterraneum]
MEIGKYGRLKIVILRRRMEAGVGGSTVAVENPRATNEVVWEVEVEDEVTTKLGGAYVEYLIEDKDPLTIQNNFRMGVVSLTLRCVL